ncbi:hypothetical protein PVAND_006505 [Polypedilum vanderplanki]|uniref:Uncharacterized protein n=1 Tax=Polypedilum vanderplanki TaxID=319348 RepID=A0A9J6C3E4_POLVA|nr:hypothetical protein PVAND_006505 [Polypedilum vanderplanki]
MIRKCEARNKQDRNLKTDKLNVLKHKIHVVATKLLGKNSNSGNVKELKLHNNDLALIEDELKPEIDVLNSVVKLVNTTNQSRTDL